MIAIPRMSGYRYCGVAVYLALIWFSATPIAGDLAHEAFLYYSDLLGFTGSSSGAHFLAQKGIHFVLFFGLGSCVAYGIEGVWRTKLQWSIGFCLVVGMSSEFLESFSPNRTPALFDVGLNAFSGAVGALAARRKSLQSGGRRP